MEIINTITPTQWLLIASIALLVLASAAGWYKRKQEEHGMLPTFGPLHDQAVADLAKRTRAEAERAEREARGAAFRHAHQ